MQYQKLSRNYNRSTLSSIAHGQRMLKIPRLSFQDLPLLRTPVYSSLSDAPCFGQPFSFTASQEAEACPSLNHPEAAPWGPSGE